MEKICIARRRNGDRTAGQNVGIDVQASAPGVGPVITADRGDDVVSFAISPEQLQNVDPNGSVSFSNPDGFGCDCRREDGQMVFNIYFKKTEPIRMLKSEQVRLMLQIGKGSLVHLVQSGRLKSYRIGSVRRFLLSDILNYIVRCEESPKAETIHSGSHPLSPSEGWQQEKRPVVAAETKTDFRPAPEESDPGVFRLQICE
jgi:hypothetical protein